MESLNTETQPLQRRALGIRLITANAAYLAGGASVLLAAALFCFAITSRPVSDSILGTQASEFGMMSTTRQVAAYGILLIAAAGVALLAIFAPARRNLVVARSIAVPTALAGAFSFILLLLGERNIYFNALYVVAFATTTVISLWGALFSGLLALARTRVATLLLALTVAFLLALFYVVPFLATPTAGALGGLIAGPQNHYSGTMMSGFDLVCCSATGTVESNPYGYGMTLLSALGYSVGQGFRGSTAGLVFAVQIYQVIAVALLAVLAFLINRARFWPVYALLVLVSLNSFAASSDTIGTPNQAGIRYIPTLIALIIFVLAPRTRIANVIVLGLTAGVLLALGLEAGVPLAGGFLVFTLLRGRIAGDPIRWVLAAPALVFVIAVLSYVIATEVLGWVIPARTGEGSGSTVLSFLGGYGQLSRRPEALAGLIFFFAIMGVLRAAFATRQIRVPHWTSYQAAIGTMILLWLPYYVNRMSYSNLSFCLVLLVLMVAPRLSSPSLRMLRWRGSTGGVYTTLLVSTLATACAVSMWGSTDSLRETLDSGGCQAPAVSVSGFCVADGPGTEELQRQIEYLQPLSRQDHLIVSNLALETRLLGFNEGFPYYEPFSQTQTVLDIGRMAGWIDAKGPQYVLLEDPTSPQAESVPNRTATLGFIGDALTCYRDSQTASGWRILSRVAATTKCP